MTSEHGQAWPKLYVAFLHWLKCVFLVWFGVGCLPLSRMSRGNQCPFLTLLCAGLGNCPRMVQFLHGLQLMFVLLFCFDGGCLSENRF